MLTTAAFLITMLVGVPISLCLALSGVAFILATGNLMQTITVCTTRSEPSTFCSR